MHFLVALHDEGNVPEALAIAGFHLGCAHMLNPRVLIAELVDGQYPEIGVFLREGFVRENRVDARDALVLGVDADIRPLLGVRALAAD